MLYYYVIAVAPCDLLLCGYDQVRGFREALDKAGVSNTISIYKGEGHAFWTNMDQVLHLWTLQSNE